MLSGMNVLVTKEIPNQYYKTLGVKVRKNDVLKIIDVHKNNLVTVQTKDNYYLLLDGNELHLYVQFI